MKITTKVVYQMTDVIGEYLLLEEESFDYTGPIALCKGDNIAQGTEQSQKDFSTTLQNAFKTNNAAQQNQLNFLNNKMQDAINNPTGYSAATLASMRAQANDAVSSQTQNVERNVNNAEMTRGGASALPSGVSSQIDAAIASQAAQAGSRAQQDITVQDANLKNQNEWNAVKAEEGVAGMENPEGMAGQATGAADSVGSLSDAVTKANGPGIGSILGNVVGAGIGLINPVKNLFNKNNGGGGGN